MYQWTLKASQDVDHYTLFSGCSSSLALLPERAEMHFKVKSLRNNSSSGCGSAAVWHTRLHSWIEILMIKATYK